MIEYNRGRTTELLNEIERDNITLNKLLNNKCNDIKLRVTIVDGNETDVYSPSKELSLSIVNCIIEEYRSTMRKSSNDIKEILNNLLIDTWDEDE